jgi:hypothetical protein
MLLDKMGLTGPAFVPAGDDRAKAAEVAEKAPSNARHIGCANRQTARRNGAPIDRRHQ